MMKVVGRNRNFNLRNTDVKEQKPFARLMCLFMFLDQVSNWSASWTMPTVRLDVTLKPKKALIFYVIASFRCETPRTPPHPTAKKNCLTLKNTSIQNNFVQVQIYIYLLFVRFYILISLQTTSSWGFLENCLANYIKCTKIYIYLWKPTWLEWQIDRVTYYHENYV